MQDQHYITCAEYQRFLDEEKASGNNYHPIHWAKSRYAKGDELKPITGISAASAKRFCEWYSNRTNARYRLPKLNELPTMNGDSRPLAHWCLNKAQQAILQFINLSIKEKVEQIIYDETEISDFSFNELVGGWNFQLRKIININNPIFSFIFGLFVLQVIYYTASYGFNFVSYPIQLIIDIIILIPKLAVNLIVLIVFSIISLVVCFLLLPFIVYLIDRFIYLGLTLFFYSFLIRNNTICSFNV